jgi:hypothetical protein
VKDILFLGGGGTGIHGVTKLTVYMCLCHCLFACRSVYPTCVLFLTQQPRMVFRKRAETTEASYCDNNQKELPSNLTL